MAFNYALDRLEAERVTLERIKDRNEREVASLEYQLEGLKEKRDEVELYYNQVSEAISKLK